MPALNKPNAEINAALMGGPPYPLSVMLDIHSIDNAFNYVPITPVDLITYRCYIHGVDVNMIDQSVNNKVFLSTSIARYYSYDYWCKQRGLTICIIIPKGSKVIPLMLSHELTNKTSQHEILLNRKGKLVDSKIVHKGLLVFI
jgi:hypothetical protein